MNASVTMRGVWLWWCLAMGGAVLAAQTAAPANRQNLDAVRLAADRGEPLA
jgi:hypothetical protein